MTKRPKVHPREKRPRGRPSVLVEGLSPEEFVEAYNKTGSARRAAKRLGVAEKTVRKYLRMQGFELPRVVRRQGVDSSPENKLPVLVRWVREHPTARLPRTVKGIAAKTGISENTVLQYFRRRKARLSSWLKTLEPRLERGRIVIAVDGMQIPSEAVSNLEYEIELLDLSVTMKLWITFGGYRVAKVPWETYVDLIGHSVLEAPWNKKSRLGKEEER